jgi:glucose/mannose-6-phosphate isomerase
MVGRIPVIYGAGIMVPVARRWKTQLNENGKTWAQWEELPEIDYNAVSGTMFPAPLMTRVNAVFLTSPQFDSPTEALRFQLTHDLYMQEGIAVDQVKGRGTDRLAQMMSAVQYGDYVSYYVAMAYGVDPTPTPATEDLENELNHRADPPNHPVASKQE